MGSVALTIDGSLVGEVSYLNRMHHSKMTVKMIHSLLKETGVPLSQIDLFAVSVGPGSFTGLRVGVATVKGFATALGKPITGVPTLEGFARQLPYTPYPICPLIPARKNEVYMALYRYEDNDNLAVLQPPRVMLLTSVRQEIKGPVHLLGEVPLDWQWNSMDKNVYYSPLFKYPRAFSVAQIALQTFKKGEENSGEVGVILPEYPSRKTEPDGILL